MDGPMIVWSLVGVAAGLLLALALRDIRRPHRYPPGPAWLPLFGSFWTFHLLARQLKYAHLAWAQLSAMYGSVVGFRLGRDHVVLVSGFTNIKEVLSREEFEGRPEGFLFRLRAFGKRLGVAFTDGKFGQEQRRFVLRHLREMGLGRSSMQDRICEETKQFISCLQTECKRGPVDIRRVANVCVLNNLWAMLAGRRFSFDDNRLHLLLDYIHQSFCLQDMSGGLLNQLPFIRFLAPERSTYNKIVEILNSTYSFLAETVEEHKKTINPDCVRDLVDAYLLEIERNKHNKDSNFNEKQLLVVMLDLFMAGSDSTSNTLGFATLFLLHHSHAQRRILSEIEAVSPSRLPAITDKPSMPYTEAFLLEVLRITSIAPVAVPHRAKESVNLDTFIIPKGTTILVNLHGLHMDKEHWGDPERFRPERFLGPDNTVVQDEWLLPFGQGRRRCLGESLARPTLFLFLTALVSHFELSIPPGTALQSLDPVDGAILSPQPFRCVLTPRQAVK